MSKPIVFVALDGLATERAKTLKTAEDLCKAEGGDYGFKVNLDALVDVEMGLREILAPIQVLNRPIFADLKVFNGIRTMASLFAKLAALGVQYTNVWALAETLLPKAIKAVEGTQTKILGLSVLTHYDEAYCQRHFGRDFPSTVRHFAQVAVENGCHGIILPGTQLSAVQDLDTFKVVPGVRPTWYHDDRHSEEAEITPGQAVADGADALVCGSPIMKWADPLEALENILIEVNQ